jgi:hypothetical protein
LSAKGGVAKGLDRPTHRRRYVRRVKFLRSIIAVLVLLAWLGAGVHMALEHGGILHGAEMGEAMHTHEEAPAEEGHHHHHDFDAQTAARLAKSLDEQFPAPQWQALDQFLAEFTAGWRRVAPMLERPGVWSAPPDERAVGWLLVCRTAHPVRGPSLAA